MTPSDILQLIHDENIEYLDLRITDSKGKEHHISYPADIDEDFFEEGKMFDGSSFAGWKGIHNSDMILMPDPATAYIDPFTGYRYYSDPELHQAMGERGLKSTRPSFERYLVGPARTSDQSAWRTEVCFPVVA